MEKSFDAIVVGSGAAGGMMVHQLTRAGLSVLLLEAGPDRTGAPTEDRGSSSGRSHRSGSGTLAAIADKARVTKDVVSRSVMEIGTAFSGRPDLQKMIHLRAADDKRVPGSERQMIQRECPVFSPSTASLYVDDVDHPYMVPASSPYQWIRSRQLGGRTQIWKRLTPRMTNHELKAAERDGHGICWPFTEAELAPAYEVAERVLRVTGSVEAGAPAHDGALPTRPMSPAETQLRDAVVSRWPDRKVSLAPYASPFGPGETGDLDTRWDSYDGGRNPGHACTVRNTLQPALLTGKLEIRCNAVVHRVLTERGGKVASGVLYLDARTGEEHRALGRVVVLAASALESTRILLLSKSEEWPKGLANSSGMVGRNLTDHLFGVGAVGVKAQRGQSICQPPILIPNFRNRLEDRRDLGFSRGYQYAGYFGALRGGPFRTWMSTLILSAHGEIIPKPRNRVTIDEAVKDVHGIPVLRIECQRDENEARMAKDMLETGVEMLEAAGYEVMMRSPEALPPGASIHEGGTVRMGDDPKLSVLNGFARTWDIPNLYVTDCAAFTSAGNQNPVLTIMALNVRAAEDIVLRMKRRDL